MNNLEWKGNSRGMYEAVINEVPYIFRNRAKKRIMEWIEGKKISSMTEELVFEAVDEIAPAGYADRIKSGLERMRT